VVLRMLCVVQRGHFETGGCGGLRGSFSLASNGGLSINWGLVQRWGAWQGWLCGERSAGHLEWSSRRVGERGSCVSAG
jgi:hypothetical protein